MEITNDKNVSLVTIVITVGTVNFVTLVIIVSSANTTFGISKCEMRI